MKKLFTISLILIVVGLTVQSCKSHERCPAYGKAENKSLK